MAGAVVSRIRDAGPARAMDGGRRPLALERYYQDTEAERLERVRFDSLL
jgi:hypothetical protein